MQEIYKSWLKEQPPLEVGKEYIISFRPSLLDRTDSLFEVKMIELTNDTCVVEFDTSIHVFHKYMFLFYMFEATKMNK